MIRLGIDGEFEISALSCLEVYCKDGCLGQFAKDGLENLPEFIDAEGAQAMPGALDPEQVGMTEDEHLQRHHVLPGMPVAVVGERFIPISGHELPLGGGKRGSVQKPDNPWPSSAFLIQPSVFISPASLPPQAEPPAASTGSRAEGKIEPSRASPTLCLLKTERKAYGTPGMHGKGSQAAQHRRVEKTAENTFREPDSAVFIIAFGCFRCAPEIAVQPSGVRVPAFRVSPPH